MPELQFSVYLPTTQLPTREAWQHELAVAEFDIELGDLACDLEEGDVSSVTHLGADAWFRYLIGEAHASAPAELRNAQCVAAFIPVPPRTVDLITTAMVAAAFAKAGDGLLRNEETEEMFRGNEAIEYARWFAEEW